MLSLVLIIYDEIDSNNCWHLFKKEKEPFSNFFLLFLSLAVVDPLRARYLIAHKIASGGFGDVYAGVRKKDGMPVALKVVPRKRMREINTVSFDLIFNNKKKILFSS
jgi:serine/threonine protein kinase